jgi:hypothetical protein
MSDCNLVATPMELGDKLSKYEGGKVVDSNNYRSLICSLRYLTCTRPDISFAVNMVSRFMEDPKYSHLKAVKRILRYIKGILRLHYTKTNKFELTCYVDSDWCGDIDDRNSTSGYTFFKGGATFTWLSKKQSIVILSTCKAEYVAASLGVSHVIWLGRLLQEVKIPQLEATEIRVDNKSAIELAKNPVHHERSKHIDVRFHLIREHIKNEEVRVVHVQSNDQAADVFTKALPKPLFENCKQMIGMKEIRDLGLRKDVGSYNHQVLNLKCQVPNLSSRSLENQNLKSSMQNSSSIMKLEITSSR